MSLAPGILFGCATPPKDLKVSTDLLNKFNESNGLVWGYGLIGDLDGKGTLRGTTLDLCLTFESAAGEEIREVLYGYYSSERPFFLLLPKGWYKLRVTPFVAGKYSLDVRGSKDDYRRLSTFTTTEMFFVEGGKVTCLGRITVVCKEVGGYRDKVRDRMDDVIRRQLVIMYTQLSTGEIAAFALDNPNFQRVNTVWLKFGE